AGDCVVVFPEGRLRRKEDVVLWPFGQGVWHILREVPETIVVPLWIEGSWGSWMYNFKGPPMTNKRFDRWRRSDIAVGMPAPLTAELMSDHRTTRDYLHVAVLGCRQYLGLKPLVDGLQNCPTDH